MDAGGKTKWDIAFSAFFFLLSLVPEKSRGDFVLYAVFALVL